MTTLLSHRKMHRLFLLPFVAAVLALPLHAQAAPAMDAKAGATFIPNYLDLARLDISLILPPPPSQDSAVTKAELAEMHRIESSYTPAQAAAARYDDQHADIFLFQSVLGPAFKPELLPQVAALSTKILNDMDGVNTPLKAIYARPRPYAFDPTLHSVCGISKGNSYPSGHGLRGYLYAFVLIQLVPEKSREILARADEFTRNRIVCEAHYPSDIEASRRVSYVMMGAMLGNPRFQQDLAAARTELRQKLNLPATPPQ